MPHARMIVLSWFFLSLTSVGPAQADGIFGGPTKGPQYSVGVGGSGGSGGAGVNGGYGGSGGAGGCWSGGCGGYSGGVGGSGGGGGYGGGYYPMPHSVPIEQNITDVCSANPALPQCAYISPRAQQR